MAVTLAASIIHTLTGFGFAVVFVSALVGVMSAKAVVVLLHLLYLVFGSILVWGARDDVDRPLLLSLLVSSLIGLPLGAYFLVVISESLLRLLIGTVIVAASLLLLFNYQRPLGNERRAAAVVGFLGGVINSSVAVCGPFVVLFLANQQVPKHRLRATISAFLLGITPVTITFFFLGGLVTEQLLTTTVLLLPPCLAGYALGIRLLPAIKPEAFRRLTAILVLAAGASIFVSEVRHLLGV